MRSAVVAWSKSLWEVMPALWLAEARVKSLRACSRRALAVSKSWAMACDAERRLSTAALERTLSISRIRSPFLTWSPSLTLRAVTWPMVLAVRSTLTTAWILPLALTLAWMFSRATVATCTGTPLSPRLAAIPKATMTASPPPRIHICFGFIYTSSWTWAHLKVTPGPNLSFS